MRKPKEPVLSEDEEVILSDQGVFRGNNFRSGWGPGHLYLTNQRFCFFQPTGVIFEIPLDDIVDVSEGERHFVLRKKEAISISYRTRLSKKSKVWIIADDLKTWRSEIYGRSLLTLDQPSCRRDSRKSDISV